MLGQFSKELLYSFSNFPYPDPLTLLPGYKSPCLLMVFEVEPHLSALLQSPTVAVHLNNLKSCLTKCQDNFFFHAPQVNSEDSEGQKFHAKLSEPLGVGPRASIFFKSRLFQHAVKVDNQ